MARQETVMVVRTALFTRQIRGEAAVKTPQGQTEIAGQLGLIARLLLLAFQTQDGGGHPAETAADQPGDQQEDDQPSAWPAQPAFHAWASSASSSRGVRS